MLNIKLPANFNSPYKAKDIQDFWRRWHITLSKFLRDYIYIPLGGNQVSKYRNYFNLFSVFLIGGLWHGASWMFVLWGALHGVAMVIHRIWKDLGFKMNSVLAWFITFNFINITWVFFRAKEWDDALKVLGGMVGFNTIFLISKMNLHPDWFILAFILVLTCKSSMEYLDKARHSLSSAFASAILFVIALLLINHASQFLYFDF
jgi:D-alanyl-lipoteichoic acid acyltransferase DltB (MBOAT superfamily)